MKKIVVVSLFIFASLLSNGQNWKSHPRKTYASSTDSCLVWADATKKFYRIKCTEIDGGGSSTIDTNKVGRIEQGRGTAPIFMYFNGTAWVRNDTSYATKSALLGYVPLTGTPSMTGIFRTPELGGSSSGFEMLYSGYNFDVSTSSGKTYLEASGTRLNILSESYSTPANNRNYTQEVGQNFVFTGAPIIGDEVYRTSDSLRYIQLKDAEERFAPIGGGGLSNTLTNGQIYIGDATNTAFPRTFSGDVTVSNLGVTALATVNSNVGTFGSATQTPVLVSNAKGLITSLSNTTITPSIGSVTGLGSGVATALGVNTGTNGAFIVRGSSDYELPLTFSTGLTRATNTITNNLSTGVSGGQTIIGSTSTTSGLTYKATTGVGTTGANHIFLVGNNGATEAMRILNSGNIGIGISTPLYKIDIAGTNEGIHTSSTNADEGAWLRGSAFAAGLTFNASFNGTQPVAKGLSSSGYLLTSTTHRFYINTGLTVGVAFTPTEIMRINSTGLSIGLGYAPTAAPTNGAIIEGRVGIGTTTPQSTLDIEGGVSIGTTYSGTTVAPPNGAIIEGSLGIGISTPSYKLHVVGTTQLTGDVTVTGTTKLNGNVELSTTTFTGVGFNYPAFAFIGLLNTSYIRFNSTVAISTVEAFPAKNSGTTYIINNVGTYDVIFRHDWSGASAIDRFVLNGSADVTIAPNGSIRFIYDGTSARWRQW